MDVLADSLQTGTVSSGLTKYTNKECAVLTFHNMATFDTQPSLHKQ